MKEVRDKVKQSFNEFQMGDMVHLYGRFYEVVDITEDKVYLCLNEELPYVPYSRWSLEEQIQRGKIKVLKQEKQ